MFDKKKYMKAWNKQDYKDNREERLVKSKKWNKDNPEKVKEHNEQWRKNNPDYFGERRRYIRDYKLLKGCSICGYNKCAEALSFHHNGDKEFDVSEFGSRSLEEIKKEIEKCEVLCMNCHAEENARKRERGKYDFFQ